MEMFYIKGSKETRQHKINSRPNPILEGRKNIKNIRLIDNTRIQTIG